MNLSKLTTTHPLAKEDKCNYWRLLKLVKYGTDQEKTKSNIACLKQLGVQLDSFDRHRLLNENEKVYNSHTEPGLSSCRNRWLTQ